MLSRIKSRFRIYWNLIFNWEDRVRKSIGLSELKWSQLSQSEKELLRDIYYKSRGLYVKFKISEEKTIPFPSGTNFPVSGYFEGKPNQEQGLFGIAVGGDKNDWLPILIHESCHMDQWSDPGSVWSYCYLGSKDVYDLMDEWVSGEEMPRWEIRKVLKHCIRVELDCEKRVIEKIKKYGLDFDINEYIQRSNSYIFFYGAILRRRKWYVYPPYRIPEIYSLFPKYFLEVDDYLDIDDSILEIYDNKCFKE